MLWSYDLTSRYKVSARPEIVRLNKIEQIEQIETDRCCDQAVEIRNHELRAESDRLLNTD